jgi:formyltetrahydrofolate hydrolase
MAQSAKRYGFYTSNSATLLRSYLSTCSTVKSNIAFVLIDTITEYNKHLKELCSKFEIPFIEYSYESLGLTGKCRAVFTSNKLLELLDLYKVDYCFFAARRIIQGPVIEKYRYRLINFHASLLPAYPGGTINGMPIDWALRDGALLLGNTAHFAFEKVDTGYTIMQSIITVKEFKNYESILSLQLPMLTQLIAWIEDNRFVVENGLPCIKGASYKLDRFIPNLEITDNHIDWIAYNNTDLKVLDGFVK